MVIDLEDVVFDNVPMDNVVIGMDYVIVNDFSEIGGMVIVIFLDYGLRLVTITLRDVVIISLHSS